MTAVLEPEAAPVIRRALYPVSVVLPDGTSIDLVKLVVTEQRVYAFAGGPTGVDCAYQAPYSDAELAPPWAGRRATSTVTTGDGTLVATNIGGCGCQATALKLYRPFPNGPERLG